MTTKKHSPKLLERAIAAAKRRLHKTQNACANIGRIFTGDLQKIRNNTIAWIVVMGLTIVPSLYAWFNIAASWDPYGNTGNLKVAVANMDAGYRGSLFPMTLNVGDQVEMNLHHNTQLDWVFTDEDAAIRGVQEGTYYAAIVLPETFSRDMMSLFSAEDIQRSDILYYLNEKENAIAPKITDKGASAVQKQIDQVFVQTVSEIGLDLLEGLNQALDEGKKKDAMQNFSRNLGSLAAELEDVAALTDNYADITASLGKITDSAAALLHASVGNAGKAQQSLQEVIESVSDLTGAVTGASKAVNLALQQTKDSYLEIEAQIDEAMDLFYQDVETAQQTLLDLSEQVMQQAEATQKIQKSLENLKDSLPSGSADIAQALDVVIRTLQTQIELQQELSSGLKEAAQELLTTKAEIEQRRQSLKAELKDSYAQITLLQADYEKNIEAKLLQLIEGFEASGTAVIDLLDQADRAAAQVDDTTGEISDHLTALQSALRDTSKDTACGNAETAQNSRADRPRRQNGSNGEYQRYFGNRSDRSQHVLVRAGEIKDDQILSGGKLRFGDGTVLFGAFHLGRRYCAGSNDESLAGRKTKSDAGGCHADTDLSWQAAFVLAHRSFSKRADLSGRLVFPGDSVQASVLFPACRVVYKHRLCEYDLHADGIVWRYRQGDLRRAAGHSGGRLGRHVPDRNDADVFPKAVRTPAVYAQHDGDARMYRRILRKHVLGGARQSLLVSGSLPAPRAGAAQADH